MRSSARLRARSCSAASASAQDTHVATSARTACQVSLTPRRQGWTECPPSHRTCCIRKPGARPTDQHEGHGAGTVGGPTSGLVLPSEGSGLSSLARQPGWRGHGLCCSPLRADPCLPSRVLQVWQPGSPSSWSCSLSHSLGFSCTGPYLPGHCPLKLP